MEDARLPLTDGPPSADLVADADRALMLRAAWHYFIEERTQADIADILGVTRFRVNRMLAECRAEGHVRVEITAPLASCVAAERQLVEVFGLTDAIVVPTPVDPERTHAMIGAGLARYMSGRVADPDTRIFGIGWGRTMREMLRFLRPVERPESKVVTLLGALPKSSEENAIEIIGKLGRMLNAERYYMTAPIYADTPESREVLVTQPFYTSVRDLILASDVACFAASEMSETSLLIRLGLPRGTSLEELRAEGAVGEVLGTFLDIDGHPVDHPINAQLVGPGPEELRGMKTLVLASGGTRKTDIITGALRSGLIHVLVCDEATARKVLSRGPLRKR